MLPSYAKSTPDTRRTRTLVLVFGAVALVASVVLSAWVFRESQRRESEAVTSAGAQLAAAFEHEIGLRTFAVESMAAQMEDALAGRARPTANVASHLLAVPAHHGFTLDVPPGYSPAEIGNLTGEGPMPVQGSPAADEMAAAFALSPTFRAIAAPERDVPWVYYLSLRGFVYLYPRVGPEEFFWSHDLLRSRALGTDDANRRNFWSSIYTDTGGKGLLSTVSRRVVSDGRLVGSVNVDVSIRTFTWLLASYRVPGASVHLLNAAGKDVLDPTALRGLIPITSLRPGRLTRVGDREVVMFPLRPTGWHLAVVTPRRTLVVRALRESMVYGCMVLFMLASLVLLVSLTGSLRQLAALTVRDALTGVFNRRHFDEVVRAELARVRRGGGAVGLALIDIDQFKQFNDRYGHPAGDLILRTVAEALRATLRRDTDRLFRVGGEEFAVLVTIERPDQLGLVAEKLCEAVRALAIPHESGAAGYVTISVGATTVDATHWLDFEATYQQADRALYRAKEAGRDRVELS